MTCAASAAFVLHSATRTLLYINSQCKQARQFGYDYSIAVADKVLGNDVMSPHLCWSAEPADSKSHHHRVPPLSSTKWSPSCPWLDCRIQMQQLVSGSSVSSLRSISFRFFFFCFCFTRKKIYSQISWPDLEVRLGRSEIKVCQKWTVTIISKCSHCSGKRREYNAQSLLLCKLVYWWVFLLLYV